METVQVSLEIEPAVANATFDKVWNFEVGDFRFSVTSPSVLKVEFSYSRPPDSEPNTYTTPSQWDQEYLNKEADLEVLIDLLALHSGVSFRIVPNSHVFTSPKSKSFRNNDAYVAKLPDLSGMTIRFQNLVENRRSQQNLLNALRLFRLAAGEDNHGEKIVQLWGALEQLFGQQDKKLLSRDEKRKVFGVIEAIKGLSQEKKNRLKAYIPQAHAKSTLDLMAERIQLTGDNGPKSPQELRLELDPWRSKRGNQAHGAVLQRDEEIEDIADDMEDVVEILLDDEVRPKLYFYLIFKRDDLNNYGEKNPSLVIKDGYCLLPLRHEYPFLTKMVSGMLTSDGAVAYWVEHNRVRGITRNGVSEVNPDKLNGALQKWIKKSQEKISGDNDN